MNDGQASGRRVVALVGFRPDLQFVLEDILDSEGLAARPVHLGPETAEGLARLRPDLVLLGAGMDPGHLELLDALRTRAETGAIPVIVFGTLEPILDQARASGNVRAVVPMPFDLDTVLEAVAAALGGTPFEARIRSEPVQAEPGFREAADLLAGAQRAVMLEWVQRIRAVEPFRGREDISVREFLDNVPRILNAIALILRHAEPDPPGRLAGDPDLADRIRSHAATRRAQGVPAEAVVGEYQVLRDVILRHLERALPADRVPAVRGDLDSLIDRIVAMTVAEYGRMTDEPS